MKNTQIKYKTSVDYDNLYKLLKNGILIIGFIAIEIKGVPNFEYSKMVQMSYNSKLKSFDLGLTFFEIDFDKSDFIKICEQSNLRFIPLD